MAEERAMQNPGSPEAVEQGCGCPVIENAHGSGYMGHAGMFVYTAGCPLHWPVGTERGPFVAVEELSEEKGE